MVKSDSHRLRHDNQGTRCIATDLHVGMRLRLRRQVLDMPAEAFAQASGISAVELEAYEEGVTRIDASRLYQFAEYLSVPVSWFFDGLDAETEALFGGGSAGAHAVTAKAELKEGFELLEFYYHSIREPAVRRSLVEVARALSERKVDQR